MMLRDDPSLEIVGEHAGGDEAVRAIREVKPDLLFLDIQMPGKDGFALLQEVGEEQMPFVVFVTAYDQHALEAFRVHAIDYLLKPFDRERFHEALRRGKEMVRKKREGEISQKLIALLSDIASTNHRAERIMVKSGGRISFLRSEEIDWVEAQGDYVQLHVQGKKHLIREKISGLEHQLPADKFVRIHRSTIVNVDRIREMQPLFYGEYAVILNDGTRLTLSRSFRERVFNRLSSIS